MLLETSFCGSKPIPTKSIEIDSPPKEGLIFLPTECVKTAQTTVQVHQTSITPTSIAPIPPFQPKKGQSSTKVASSEKYSHTPGSPKSSNRWRPISPTLTYVEAVYSESWSPRDGFGTKDSESACTESLPTQHVDELPTTHITATTCEPKQSSTAATKECSQSLEKHSVPLKNKAVEQMNATDAVLKSPAPHRKSHGNANTKHKGKSSHHHHSSSEGTTPNSNTYRSEHGVSPTTFTPTSMGVGDEKTNELKISEDAMVPVEDVPIEAKSLCLQGDSSPDDDGDLPFVPTTLPLEKSSVVPIVPVKDRKKYDVATMPVQRPRSNRPHNPASLNDYIAYSTVPRRSSKGVNPEEDLGNLSGGDSTELKMKINLPRDDSLPDSPGGKMKAGRRKVSTSWTDFAQQGLRSPREIRRRLKQGTNHGANDSSYHRYVKTSAWLVSWFKISTLAIFSNFFSDSSPEENENASGPVRKDTDATHIASDDETSSLLKLSSGPFDMDLNVKNSKSSEASRVKLAFCIL